MSKITLTGIRSELVGSPSERVIRALAEQGQITYSSVIEPVAKRSPGENRLSGRQRTRLRSAKLLDENYKFLTECRVHDRSPKGLRLALTRNTGLPGKVWFFDDETGEVLLLTIVWRKGETLGARHSSLAQRSRPKASVQFALATRYYGMPS